jgi:hypothetical protein
MSVSSIHVTRSLHNACPSLSTKRYTQRLPIHCRSSTVARYIRLCAVRHTRILSCFSNAAGHSYQNRSATPSWKAYCSDSPPRHLGRAGCSQLETLHRVRFAAIRDHHGCSVAPLACEMIKEAMHSKQTNSHCLGCQILWRPCSGISLIKGPYKCLG